MKKLIAVITAAIVFLTACPPAFASGEVNGEPDASEDVTIVMEDTIHPVETWRYQAQSLDGMQSYPVLQAAYHGSELTITADGYDGTGNILIYRGEEDGGAGGEFSMEFDLAAFFASMEASGDMPVFDMGGGTPDPEVVGQFERIGLDPLV